MKKHKVVQAPVEPVVMPEVNDFVFLDDANRPYRVKLWGNSEKDLWIFYWHPDRKWVSLRPIQKTEALILLSRGALSKDQAAALYGA